jgi:hypothetical protein
MGRDFGLKPVITSSTRQYHQSQRDPRLNVSHQGGGGGGGGDGGSGVGCGSGGFGTVFCVIHEDVTYPLR